VLTAIDFRVRTPGFFRVSALLLEHISRVIPAFKMSAAELALSIFLVAGTLPGLFQFYFVMRELFRRNTGFGCGQSLILVDAAGRRFTFKFDYILLNGPTKTRTPELIEFSLWRYLL